MTKNLDPNSQGYTNALLEDINDKFEILTEGYKEIPKMQADIKRVLKMEEKVDMIPAIIKQVAKIPEIEKQVAKIPEIEKQTNKIPGIEKTLNATFEEVGKLRLDVDDLKRSSEKNNKRQPFG